MGIIEEHNGMYFETDEIGQRRRVWECRRLFSSDYENLLKRDKWELFEAVCFLLGYSDLGEEIFYEGKSLEKPNDFGISRQELNDAMARGRDLYEKIKISTHKREILCEGAFDKTPIIFTRSSEPCCWVIPYNVIKWALLKNIPLSTSLLCKLRFWQKFDKLGKCKADRLRVQAMALAFWGIDDKLVIPDIEQKIRETPALGSLLSRTYEGENTFRGWIGKIDPRSKEHRIGPKPKGNARWGKISLEPIAKAFNRTHLDHPQYDFQALHIAVVTSAVVLFYNLPSANPCSVFEHPVIQSYIHQSTVFSSEFLHRLIYEWVEKQDACKVA